MTVTSAVTVCYRESAWHHPGDFSVSAIGLIGDNNKTSVTDLEPKTFSYTLSLFQLYSSVNISVAVVITAA
ncbi:MAG: hypothetical protein ACI89U_002004 [Gammaproteobacteria bacterium]|jgi:hypothetical protein